MGSFIFKLIKHKMVSMWIENKSKLKRLNVLNFFYIFDMMNLIKKINLN